MMVDMPPSKNTARTAIDAERREIFLRTLAATGSISEAARVASPHARGARHGYHSFRRLIRTDPEFAQRVEEARSEALARVEELIYRHATEGVQEPVFQSGRLVGTRQVFDHKLLLRLAARLDTRWAQRTKSEVDAKIATEDDAFTLKLSAEDVLALPREDQETLVRIIEKIAERKEKDGPESLP
jgi:hypothetical protein